MSGVSTDLSGSKTTPLAIAMGLVMVIPGMFLGGLAVVIYSFITSIGMARVGDDGSWIPFLDGLFNIIWLTVMPEIIRGAVAMGAALWVTFFAFKRSNREVVTYSVLTAYLIVTLGLIVFGWAHKGFSLDLIGAGAMGVGLVVGGIFARESTI